MEDLLQKQVGKKLLEEQQNLLGGAALAALTGTVGLAAGIATGDPSKAAEFALRRSSSRIYGWLWIGK